MERKLESERRQLLHSIDRLMEGPLIFLGFVWLILLITELIWGLTKPMEYLSITIWIIFIIDFIVKFLLAPHKLEFFKKNWLTAISLIVPALRLVRAIRVVRLVRSLRGVRLVRLVSSINRSMRSLAATMQRRGVGYVFLLTVAVIFAGAAGMYAIERPAPGFENYGMALWWTAMRVITAGSEYFPYTPEGRGLAFMLAIFGYAVFGYVTATLATFFIGRDAEEKDAPVAGAKDVHALKLEIQALSKMMGEMSRKMEK